MSKNSQKSKVLNSVSTFGPAPQTSKDRLGLIALEPRILLDAAGFVTGADVAMEAMNAHDAMMGVEVIFSKDASNDQLVLSDMNVDLIAALNIHEQDLANDRADSLVSLTMVRPESLIPVLNSDRPINEHIAEIPHWADIGYVGFEGRENFYSIISELRELDHMSVAMFDSEPLFMSGPPVVDLNGPDDAGIDFETSIQPTTTNIFSVIDFDATVMSSTGFIDSVTIDFGGIVDVGDELAFHNGPAGSVAFFLTPGTQIETVALDAGGTVLLDVTRNGTSFTITGVGGTPTADVNIQTFLSQFLYGDLAAVATEGARTMSVTLTDSAGVGVTAISTINVHYFPNAGDDVNTVTANVAVPVSGNVLANDSDPTIGGGPLMVSEVDSYPAALGQPYQSTYGTLTLNADGSYDYEVDVNNATVLGLQAGASVTDIIAYTVVDPDGNADTAFLTVTINGVDEVPIATDNTNSVTHIDDPVTAGNVIFDDDGFGVDSGDRPLSQLIWENEFSDGESVAGRTVNVNGVTVTLTSTDPAGNAAASNHVVSHGINGGHEGFLVFTAEGGDAANTAHEINLGFSEPVTNVSFTLADLDWSQVTAWQDQFTVIGLLNGEEVDLAAQVSGTVVQVGDNTFYGTGIVPPTEAHGNVNILFNTPVDEIRILYNFGPDATVRDGFQIGALSDLNWQSTSVPRVSAIDGVEANVGAQVAGQYGWFTINGDGSYTYEVDPNNPDVMALMGTATLIDTIPYTLIDTVDNSGNTDIANLSVTINAPNAPPVPVIPGDPNPPVDPLDYIPLQTEVDSRAVTELVLTPYFTDANHMDAEVTLSLDPDDLPAGLIWDPVTETISGTPDPDASQGGIDGTYVIAVTATDPLGASFTTNVTYVITNPVPDAVDDMDSTTEDTAVTGNVITGSDSDPDGDDLTVTEVGGETLNVGVAIAGTGGGLFTIDANGDFTFDPNGEFEMLDAGETATSTITYQISDGEGGFDMATVTITITGQNDAPVVTGTLVNQTGVDSTAQIPFDASTVFSDIDIETLSFTSPDLPSWMMINSATGIITGTPPADASQGGPNDDGVYTVTIMATDPDGASISTTVIYTFTNPPPVVDTPIGPQTAVDTETISIPTMISDPDGDELLYTVIGLPPGLSIDPSTGDITGTLDNSASQGGPNDDGVYTITVTADDGEGGVITDTFTLTVTNPGPIAQDDHLTVSEDTASITGSVYGDNGNGMDRDPDGDDLTVTLVDGDMNNIGAAVAGSNGGLFTINSDGTYTFETNGEFEGLDSGETATTTITYQISDGEGGFDTAVVTVTVTGENDGPIVTGTIPDQIGEDSDPLTDFDISVYFADPDMEVSFFALENAPSWMVINPFTGVITGTPPADASQGGPDNDGIYPITIVASDIDGEEIRVTFNYTITNPDPFAQDDDLSANEDGPIITGNIITDDNGHGIDNDPDGDALFVAEVNGDTNNIGLAVTGSLGGLFTVNADGSYSFDPNGDFEYLDIGETTTTTITYLVSDGQGGTDLATVTVTIEGANDAPIVTGTLAAQSGDDSAPLAPLDASAVFDDVDIEDLTFSSPDMPVWMMIDPVTGEVTGTPPADASQGGPNGDGVYIVTIVAIDPDGESVSTSVTYMISNPAPTAQDDIEVTDEDTVLSDSVLTDNGNGVDSDPDGDVLMVTQVNGVAITSGAVIVLPSGALLIMNADGSYEYDPNGQYEGLDAGETAMDSFSYQISDGEGGFSTATVTITIDGVNDAPVVTGTLPPQTGPDSAPLTPFDAAAAFGDVDGEILTFSSPDMPAWMRIDPVTGEITGTPPADASQGGPNGDGVYIITIIAADPDGETASTSVTYSITNPPPVAGNDSYSTAEDTPITVNIITDNDTDPDGDDLVIDAIALPDGTVIPVGVQTQLPEGLLTVNADGIVTFDPTPDFNGTLTFGYTLSDGEGGTDVATVSIEVTPVNDAPIPVDPTRPPADPLDPRFPVDPTDPHEPPLDPNDYIPVQNGEDSNPMDGLDLTPYFGDPDPDDILTISLDPNDLPRGMTFDPLTGIISGTPDADASQGGPNGDGIYEIAVTVTDQNGESFTTTLTYVITNPAPVAVDDGVLEIIEDTETILDLLGNDNDPDGDDLIITEINGSAITVGVPTALPSGAVIILNADGSVSYDPPADYNGPDSFTYTISDGEGGTDTASVTLDITPVNDAPIVTPPVAGEPALPPRMNRDGDMIDPVDVSGAFDDIDDDPLVFTASGLPDGLVIDPDTGLITGTLPPGTSANGPFIVIITASDPDGASVSTEFVWTVDNIPPVVQMPLVPVTVNDADDVIILTAPNFDDLDGDDIIFTATGLPLGLTIDPDTGVISGRVDSSASVDGPYDVIVTVTDTQGASTSSPVVLTVLNPAPVIGEINLPTPIAGEPVTIDVAAVTGDADEDAVLTYSAVDLPPGLSINPATGIISGTPTAPQADPYIFTVTADDGEGGFTTVELTLQVNEDGFVGPIEPIIAGPLIDGIDPYEFLDDKPIDLQRFFRDRALDNRDSYGRMFGDRDFLGGMMASPVDGFGTDCAYLVVEAVAYEHHITVQLDSTLALACDIKVQSWDVDMANGGSLPGWIDWQDGADSLHIQRPLDQDTIRLRLRGLLDNARSATVTVEIDLRTGSVTEIGKAFSQSQLLGEQLKLESRRLTSGSAELIHALAS